MEPVTLSSRELEILHAIIKNYIATGEPVASKTVSERRRDHLSPASVRNVMARLEAEGLLTHPHTSAGRLPTEKALREYVRTLATPRLERSAAEFITSSLQEANSIEERMGRSSHVLAALTRQLGVVVLAPLSEAVIEHVQFQKLAERRVLIVLVLRGDVVRHRIVGVSEEIAPEELERIANYVNRNFAGWRLAEARQEILRRIEEERALYDEILRRLRALFLQGFLAPEGEAQVYLEGASNLVVETLGAERARALLEALEEKQKLIELLDECMRGEMAIAAPVGAEGATLCVRIGLEDAYPAMKDFAVIGAVCAMESGLAGRIAVIGPTRMPYERVLSAVAHVASVIQNLTENN